MISQNCQVVVTHCDTVGCLHSVISLFAHRAASHLHSQLCPAEETGQRNIFFLFLSTFRDIFRTIWLVLLPPCTLFLVQHVANWPPGGINLQFPRSKVEQRLSKDCSVAEESLFALVRSGSLLKHARRTINHVFQGIFFPKSLCYIWIGSALGGRVPGPVQTCIRKICLDPVRTLLHTFHSNIRRVEQKKMEGFTSCCINSHMCFSYKLEFFFFFLKQRQMSLRREHKHCSLLKCTFRGGCAVQLRLTDTHLEAGANLDLDWWSCDTKVVQNIQDTVVASWHQEGLWTTSARFSDYSIWNFEITCT